MPEQKHKIKRRISTRQKINIGRRIYMSNKNKNPCGSHKKRCKNICCCPIDTVLNAATGGAGPLPAIVIGDLTQPLPVVSVTVDIGRRCDPSVLLKFTTLISLPTAVEQTVLATLSFEVVRSVNNGTPVKVGPSFTYSITATTLVTDSFAFQLFDSDVQPGTYTYTVQLSTNTAISLAGATLIDSTLSALALLTD